ncbi:protein ABHD11-like isoform X2 [Pollicipes pollicipes]|uniref:protein ABHD11-like isoform X2 n=1 Tax=Pollicipes pollicipes TaxID=41117 RepID=UPI0018854E31|nr:protein ABHD11-like isoform X2 [Pollicipes pollicipes]
MVLLSLAPKLLASVDILGSRALCRRVPLYFKRCPYSSQHSGSLDLSFQSHDSTSPATPDMDHPPILIMHGLLGSKSNWNSLSKSIHLKTKRKVINIDARNHGDSPHSEQMDYDVMAQDVIKLIADLKQSKVTLMGHSMGGKTMMMVALNNPRLVSSLVVVDIAPCTRPRAASDIPGLLDALAGVRVTSGRSQWAVRKEADGQLERAIPDKYLRQFLLTNLVEEAGVVRWRVNLPVLQRSLPRLAAFPRPPTATYEGPTLFVGGQNSNYIEPSAQDEIRALFPAARFIWIPDAGHWVHSEQPARFLEAVCPFLAS